MAPLTHVLFDFFGTLVRYSDSLVEQGFQGSYEVLVSAGASLDYENFLEQWSSTFNEFEARAQLSLDEFSMEEVCGAFLDGVLPHSPDGEVVTRFRDIYLLEWSTGVQYIAGLSALLADLSQRYTLALVTNTHRAELVSKHLRAMGAEECFDVVITSVEHGKRKPHSTIFEEALEQSGGRPNTAVHIGDSYSTDYLGATRAGLAGLLIDPSRRYKVPEAHRMDHVLEIPQILAAY
jgi:putative hydrolase of the HAD superfamily